FFARLWRRAHVMTDVEFAEIRYGGKPATFLRGFRALYLAIPINLIILGWVTRAMIKILTISLGLRTAHIGSETGALSFLPVKITSTGIHAYPWMPLVALLTFLSVQWWAAWYPGAE